MKDNTSETINRDLDARDRWLGMRKSKGKYKPIPYPNKDKEGKHLGWIQRANQAADYIGSKE